MFKKLIMKLPPVRRLQEQLDEKASFLEMIMRNAADCRRQLRELRKSTEKKAARISIEGRLSEEAIAEMLNGTENHPIMKAVFALLSAKVVEQSDVATDRPRATVQTKDGVIQGYSAEERLHDAGGAAQAADILARLQELAKAKEPEPAGNAA